MNVLVDLLNNVPLGLSQGSFALFRYLRKTILFKQALNLLYIASLYLPYKLNNIYM